MVDRIQSGGTLIVNLDDPHALAAIERASKGVNIFSFSTQNPLADLIATRIETSPRGMRFSLSNGKECIEVNSPMPFSYNVENALAIASVLSILGWDLSRVATAIEAYKCQKEERSLLG
ncbi:UDP-N-acetylmuramoylalanyl-D-glutamate-2,6-diaminopimelate ligase [Vibrio sp. JCM 19236]|nr:UDP-N-acetylmuramoylalanyl-D-glutamate-2,6-diaminopimelate ligase [Vibrio sp. JCM 19236]